MKFNIVTIDEKINFDNEEEFVSYCEKQGLKKTGVLKSNFYAQELINKPTYSELSGPMYDGKDSVRYETWEAYEVYSR